MIYQPFADVNADLSQTPLSMCAQQLGPSFVYTLIVNPTNFQVAHRVLRDLMCSTKDNPFAPYVNLVTADYLAPSEWFLSANGKNVGSRGVG